MEIGDDDDDDSRVVESIYRRDFVYGAVSSISGLICETQRNNAYRWANLELYLARLGDRSQSVAFHYDEQQKRITLSGANDCRYRRGSCRRGTLITSTYFFHLTSAWKPRPGNNDTETDRWFNRNLSLVWRSNADAVHSFFSQSF